MDARRLLSALALVLLSAGAGFLLADVLRSPGPDREDDVVRRQAETIRELEAEVRRLESRVEAAPREAEAADPTLAGTADARPPNLLDPPGDTARTRSTATLEQAPERPTVTRGGVLDLVRTLGARDARQEDTTLVGDPETMATLFAPRAAGPTVRAEDAKPEGDVADGTTIVLDAGVYDYAAFAGAHRGDFPADVTFRGVGTDRTLLILHEIGSTGEARNLGFEDLTLDTRGHYLADVRGDEPISLRFERARVIGWDQKPGGAVLLAARHGAVLARDSRFEAGFGNAPGEGAFFHVRGPFLVRFERCTFVGPFARLYERSERAAYAWVDCAFEALPEAGRREIERPEPNLVVEGCRFEVLPPGVVPPVRTRSELNPAWE